MRSSKHIIQCRCVLNQFRNKKNPPLHKFIAFSSLDDDDKVEPTFVSCNNCGITHKIVDLCKSEILENSENSPVITIKDILISLPSELREIFESYEVDLATMQNALWIIDNQLWGSKLILLKKELEDRVEGKYLVFKQPNQYRIETFLEENNELKY